MTTDILKPLYSSVKETELSGRYITNSHIEKLLPKFPGFKISGYSVKKKPIYSFEFGKGPIKVLLWSQMHGNESTSTKALFDCFNLFAKHEVSEPILDQCTLLVIPVLNPDGAEVYTRFNANDVDLNRDAQDLSQPESILLQNIYNQFKPHYCFNLHGQRTIFGVGSYKTPATLSFLSPSEDTERSITATRIKAMSVISIIHKALQQELPNGVGRYDDGFNHNCVGDTFQVSGTPTILFESGHYPNDYNREEVRKFTYIAIMIALKTVANDIVIEDYKDYFLIPENSKSFYDIIIRNVKIPEENSVKDIAFQFKECLEEGKIKFIPKVEKISKLIAHFGHREIDAKDYEVFAPKNTRIKVGDEIDFVMINNEKIALNIH